ncbi:ROK family glucokinase [Oceanobacillus manasiensis]|uniref:ROK family glucokinase n=1 Tax=Oceanobacillus manasiensis TaxID=586413 RepID=UPI0005AA6CA4|nr:ROK family glucokinase [Oceanobacillus manasiensis]
MAQGKWIAGVDIGGTTVKIGIISTDGVIHKKWEINTDKSDGGIHIIEDIWASVNKQLDESGIPLSNVLGVGLGAPGFIDGDTGYIFEAVNIGWKNYDLPKHLKAISGVPVFVENDANVAVLGENWKGAGQQEKNVIAITLGTGVGGGVIANGEILNGANGMAGEIGHMTIEKNGRLCNCGRSGCLETIASATGIVRQAMEYIESDKSSGKLVEHVEKHGVLTAKDIFDYAAQGEEKAISIVNYTTDVLGLMIANMGTLINPSKVLIGGGVSKAGSQLLDKIKESFDKYALERVSSICEMRIAELGNDAGIIGAAFLVKQKVLHVSF